MRKIPTMFMRDEADRARVTKEPNPDCDWVFRGEGRATRKMDGTCCAVIGGIFYKRREVAKDQSPPGDFVPEEHDEITGKTVGWVPVDAADKWHLAAWNVAGGQMPDGTYELVGPKVQGNPEGAQTHMLISHSYHGLLLADAPRTFDGLAKYLGEHDIEGIVWHHPDGRMAKLKGRDFGIKRRRA